MIVPLWEAHLRGPVKIKSTLVLYVKHQVSSIQKLHDKEEMFLFETEKKKQMTSQN